MNHTNRQRKARLLPLLMVLISLAVPASAHAVTIHWGNSLFDSLKQSDGITPINDVDFTVQLGFFDGISPDISNVDQWQSNWRVFDQANFNSAIGYFTGSANLNETTRTSDSPFAQAINPLTTFPSTAQAHIWISNGGAANQPGTEWAVFTNPNWKFPETGQHDQVEWRVSDPGTTAVFGAVVTPSSGPSTIQAATFPVIPEPGTATLLLLGIGLALRRKRRELPS